MEDRCDGAPRTETEYLLQFWKELDSKQHLTIALHLFFFYLCKCVYVYVCICVQVCVCEEAGGQSWVFCSVNIHLDLWSQGFLLLMRLSN